MMAYFNDDGFLSFEDEEKILVSTTLNRKNNIKGSALRYSLSDDIEKMVIQRLNFYIHDKRKKTTQMIVFNPGTKDYNKFVSKYFTYKTLIQLLLRYPEEKQYISKIFKYILSGLNEDNSKC